MFKLQEKNATHRQRFICGMRRDRHLKLTAVVWGPPDLAIQFDGEAWGDYTAATINEFLKLCGSETVVEAIPAHVLVL